MKIAASVFFDCVYIESALLTAFELSRKTALFDALHLIYLDRGQPDDGEAKTILVAFLDAMRAQGGVPMHAIEVKDKLPQFQSYHFNNAIVYKPLIPSLLHDRGFVLNIDAGILLGREFDEYVRGSVAQLCHPDAQWVVAGNCTPAASELKPQQLLVPHHALYPNGQVLLFNVPRYHATAWADRYMAAYEQHRAILSLAEQELMCMVCQPHELRDLVRAGQVINHTLGDEVLRGRRAALPSSAADDCIYFKVIGSIKPWKYWVLDPDKAVYSRRRKLLEDVFPLAGRPLIEAQRKSCIRTEWIEAYQMAYDAYLAGAPDPTRTGTPC